MKKIIALMALLPLLSLPVFSQEDEVKLDLLKAPSSPASNLLGIAPSDIDKPTDVSAFMLSLQKASSNFSALPANYAFDIAPLQLCKKKSGDNTINSFRNSTGGYALMQTLVLSFAMRNTGDDETDLLPNTVYGGFGFKFSLARGNFDKVTTDKLLDIQDLQGEANDLAGKSIDKYVLKTEVIQLYDKRKALIIEQALLEEKLKIVKEADSNHLKERHELLKKLIEEVDKTLGNNILLKELRQGEKAELKEKIKKIASEFQVARVGWTLDIAGGTSASFVNKKFDNSRVNNAGLWLSGGWTDDDATGKYFGSLIGLARVLYNPDKIFANDNAPTQQKDVWTFDWGGRYIYSRPQSKFSTSVEGIRRWALTPNTIQSSWRLVFNADYALWANQKLTFSFGRQFDGTTTKDGNLIAALSFLTGFGTKK